MDGKTYYGGSTDKCQDDEFLESIKGLDKLIREIKHFREAAKSYYEKMNEIYDSIEEKYDIDYGGLNPVTYNWTDSRSPADSDDNDEDGDKTELLAQSVSVQTSQYRVPYVKKKKAGVSFQKPVWCLRIIRMRPAAAPGEDNRREPANASVGAGGLSLGNERRRPRRSRMPKAMKRKKKGLYQDFPYLLCQAQRRGWRGAVMWV